MPRTNSLAAACAVIAFASSTGAAPAKRGAPPAWAVGQIVSIRSATKPDLYVRHCGGLGFVDRNDGTNAACDAKAFKQDVSFRLVAGLAGGDSVSFESVNYPGWFLRHDEARIKLAASDDSPRFGGDASFHPIPAPEGTGTSLLSVNLSGGYVRSCGGALYVDRNDGLNKECKPARGAFNAEVRFELVAGLSGQPASSDKPPAAVTAVTDAGSDGSLPTIDLKSCVSKASPQWKTVGLSVLIRSEGNTFSATTCRAYDNGRADGTSNDDLRFSAPLEGAFGAAAPGWEVQGADGTPLFRTVRDVRQSAMCTYLEAPPPAGGGSFANAAQPGGAALISIPVVAGATSVVIYDAPCGVVSFTPMVRLVLR